jgi:ABC-type multidrug transport system ATPase subunit
MADTDCGDVKENPTTTNCTTRMSPPVEASGGDADEAKDLRLDGHKATVDDADEKSIFETSHPTSVVASSSHVVDGNGNNINNLTLHAVDPVTVRVHNVSVAVDPTTNPSRLSFVHKKDAVTPKAILTNISATFRPGTLTAILGGSGSGKTTFLNVLSHRLHGRHLNLGGSTTYNGNTDLSQIRSAYVMQQDVLLPTLTVRETLSYAAELRLPPTSAAERTRIVAAVIQELGLKECADTRIGSSLHAGCSGGEKRRVSIGVQLLANPAVLFLDEPTTGLDATSAVQVVRTLKNLADKGRTVVLTVHQPRSEIWGLFDGVVVLARGQAVCVGERDRCVSWLERRMGALPPFVNPAEWVIDLAAVDNRTKELEEASWHRVEGLLVAWKEEGHREVEAVGDAIMEGDGGADRVRRGCYPGLNIGKPHSDLGRQIRVLTARTWTVTYRDPMGMAGSLVEAITMGILTGWVFFVSRRLKSIFICQFWLASGSCSGLSMSFFSLFFLIFKLQSLYLGVILIRICIMTYLFSI